ncbi:peptidoglycan-binding protein [Pseudoclavibacter sp. JSM 162008]|uniref:peptidoglycan-binding domain-containing protein n=1 Tax=Pseudoclavibacter sp. JSM 162008 TaxID=3229855 RepID=UPI003523FFD4
MKHAQPGNEDVVSVVSDSDRPARRRGFSATVALVIVATLAVAASLVAFSVFRPTPPGLATASVPSEVQLVAEELTDARAVELTAQLGDDASLPSPTSGTLTDSSCTAGGDLVSGGSSFKVGETPLVSLHTSTPLWRDLSYGLKGPDVTALQVALAGLGYDVSETDTFDWQTWSAWDDLVESMYGDTKQGELALAQVLWLPSATISVQSCPVPLGQTAAQGEALVDLANPLLSASVKSYPTDLVPGARKLTLEGVDVAIDEEGAVTPEGLSVLAGTNALAKYAASPDDASIQAELVLVGATTVYAVPPAAVAMTSETGGCVATPDGGSLQVAVVSSKLGRTYVSFPEPPTAAAVKAVAKKDLACS